MIRLLDELSGVHKGVLLPGKPEGCGEVTSLSWSEFLSRPAQPLDAVRDGVVFALTGRASRPGGAIFGYLTYWDDVAMGGKQYTTREGTGGGPHWREVKRVFSDPADAQAVKVP